MTTRTPTKLKNSKRAAPHELFPQLASIHSSSTQFYNSNNNNPRPFETPERFSLLNQNTLQYSQKPNIKTPIGTSSARDPVSFRNYDSNQQEQYQPYSDFNRSSINNYSPYSLNDTGSNAMNNNYQNAMFGPSSNKNFEDELNFSSTYGKMQENSLDVSKNAAKSTQYSLKLFSKPDADIKFILDYHINNERRNQVFLIFLVTLLVNFLIFSYAPYCLGLESGISDFPSLIFVLLYLAITAFIRAYWTLSGKYII
jgi:hypothetical protein